MGRKEFTKEEVIYLIDRTDPPTPMDADHDAVWWNSNFGKVIKSQFENIKSSLIEQITQMADY